MAPGAPVVPPSTGKSHPLSFLSQTISTHKKQQQQQMN